MTKFRVGQIVYVLDNIAQSITPAQIIVENKQKTLKGTILSYDAQLATKIEGEPLRIDDSNVENVFESSKKLKDYLIVNATRGIQTLIDAAEQRALCFDEVKQDNCYNDPDEEQENMNQTTLNDGTQLVKVRMPDGSFEMVKM
jgi:hypothetical protein